MKVYFTAAISQMPLYGSFYKRIIQGLVQLGCEVQHEHISNFSIDNVAEFKAENNAQRLDYYKKVLDWVSKADVMVVEASFPSTLHIGHEITLALEKSKPVLAFYLRGKEPFFLRGLVSDKLVLVEYTENDLEALIKTTIEYAKDQADTRFNFFISPRHMAYLDWVAQTKKVPRSVYLRQLIEEDRDHNQEFLNS